MGADYYVANLHKWCLAPNSAAFMWVAPHAPSREKLHHPIISHSFGAGIFQECAMLGTRDYSAMLTAPALFSFIDNKLGGIEALSARNIKLCYDAAVHLSEAWGTRPFCTPQGLSTSTAMIGCPSNLGDTWEDAERLRLALRVWKPRVMPDDTDAVTARCHAEGSPIPPRYCTGGIVIQKLVPIAGDRLYMRLSAACYNTMEEFEILRDAVLEISSERDRSI